MTGIVITVIGSLLAGVGTLFNLSDGDGLAGHDFADFGRVQHHDVSADGARGRSAGAAGDFRHSEYAVVFPQRSDLSDPGVSLVVARHCQR